ncbi:MAG: hypothetical protein KC613_17130 [Myxococcales bacterium]|nr:hypothetical protein [Myxococcales bacterium]MCB9522152.1 hypothetical protein [Myxococcales bacterium]
MPRLFGIFADSPVRLADAVIHGAEVDEVPTAARWGCAYTQEGKALIKEQPLRPGMTLSGALADTTSRAAVVRCWTEGDGAPRRFGSWLWGWEGELAVGAEDLREAAAGLPESLQINLRPVTPDNLLFHRVLAALQGLRVKLGFWGPPVEPVVDAIQQALVTWRAHFGRIDGRFVLATERRAFAAALGAPLGVGSWRPSPDGLEAVDEEEATVWTLADAGGPHAQPLEAGTVLTLSSEARPRRYDLTHGAWR